MIFKLILAVLIAVGFVIDKLTKWHRYPILQQLYHFLFHFSVGIFSVDISFGLLLGLEFRDYERQGKLEIDDIIFRTLGVIASHIIKLTYNINLA